MSEQRRDDISLYPTETRITRAEGREGAWYGHQAGDVVDDPLGVVEEAVNDLNDVGRGYAALLPHPLQLQESVVHQTLDPSRTPR